MALLLAEVRSQAVLIEKLQHQLAGHRNHRFELLSESIAHLQRALEMSEIAVAKTTAQLRPPDEKQKNKLKRRSIPDHMPSRGRGIDHLRRQLHTMRWYVAPRRRERYRKTGIRS